ncbi:MAG: Cyclin-dependent kinase 10 [Vezdaea aestivalis]|nr:MAG: Cyclin-dependent kinase 10 [Vezdaea aestivalis]
MASRWADPEGDAARKASRDARKAAKAAKKASLHAPPPISLPTERDDEASAPPSKRRRLSPSPQPPLAEDGEDQVELLRFPVGEWNPSRNVEVFERLNHIEEGSYGFVSRARDQGTGEVVALKMLKMEAAEGFPITGLREIEILMRMRHENVVRLREVVVGDDVKEVFLVMDFVEHDLRTLLEDMTEPFLPSETKALMQQLTRGMDFLHSNFILHRDLKTSNLLLSNRGELKIADFGMARQTSSPPPPNLTQLVVTLWYRSPELILGAEIYGPEIDVWSIGCIWGELLTRDPLFSGKNEVEQIGKIFDLCGIPTQESWPSFRRLKNAKSLRLPNGSPINLDNRLRTQYPSLTSAGASLLASLLSLNPAHRPTTDQTLQHRYFSEDPRPKSSAVFPTFPSKAGQEKRRKRETPNAPRRGAKAPALGEGDFAGIFAGRDEEQAGGGFNLRLG